jgi:mono/diheme cytochrome c family protein
MFNQPKVKPLARSDFFEDGQAARPPVEGTVARGELRADRIVYTGIGPDGKFVAALPVPLTRALVLRGRERFDIFCSPCHGRVGDGRGMIVERGFKRPPSYHIDRLRAQPIGYFFDVITNGFGQMSSYAAQVPPADRWAIAAYVRTLQLSQHAPVGRVSARDREEIEKVRP